MKTNSKVIVVFSVFCILLAGCKKVNHTKFYEDSQDDHLSIFSATGNNVMSCYIGGKPWRTINRVEYRNSTDYEIAIRRTKTSSAMDTLEISWNGDYINENFDGGGLSLTLPVPKKMVKYLNGLKGKRLHIDNTNGFFSSNDGSDRVNGQGDIYIHSIQFDSLSNGSFKASLSGILEADFNIFKIARCRFDHIDVPVQTF